MIVEDGLKSCSKCAVAKPREMFCRDKTRRDGLACWCKDCLNERSRQWHSANRESVLARHREWLAHNPPDRRAAFERTQRWCKDNPERTRALRKNAKHRRRARTQGGIKASELRAWEAEQPKVCHWCGAECSDYHIDHRVPLSRGGEHIHDNLVIACPPCNRSKGARCPIEFARSRGMSA